MNASVPMPALLMNTADSGISTIKDRYARVNPSDSPNPGRTRFERAAAILPPPKP